MNPSVLAIIPAYNEQESIASTMDDLKRHAPWVDTLIVDDGSSDATADVCRANGYRFVSHATNLGLAGAFQTGMKYAHRKGYDYAIQFDADGQHDAESIQAMLDAAVSSGADIVIMGKSLAGHDEGHNLIEPALLDKPIITGAVLRNFRFILQVLRDADAVVTVSEDAALAMELRRLASDPQLRKELGRRAGDAIRHHRGATDRTVKALESICTERR